MRLVVSKKRLIGSVGILMAALLIYNLPVILLGETALTRKVGRQVQSNLKQYGLNCTVKKVRWVGGGRFEAIGVAIDEQQSGELLIKADQLLVQTDFWQLIKHMKNPETVLSGLEIIRPQFRIVHYANQTWNISRFLGKTGKRVMKFSYKIKIRDGRGEWEDYKYGKHQFQKVNGAVNLSEYPLVTWQAKGRTTFGKDTAWSSNGQVRSDQASGLGVVKVAGIPLVKAFKVMGKKFPFAVKSGFGRGTFRFAWNRKKVWVQNGDVKIDRGVVKFPFFKRIVRIKAADAQFTPEQVVVKSSKLNYQHSELQLTGLLDIAKLTVKAKLNSKRARVEDLLEMFPEIPNTAIAGRANLNLEANGVLSSPVFDGKMAIDHTNIAINGEKFTNVTGELNVSKNNIQVSNLHGIWHEASIALKGTVANIYNPRLDLNVATQGVKLDQMQLCQMLKPDLNFGRSGDFTGKLTGYWNTPLFFGEVRLQQFVVRGMEFRDVKATITWEPMLNQRVKILSAQGKAWDGDLTVDGLMAIDTAGIKWDLTGKASGVNLKAISQLPDVGLEGKNLAADAVFKGAWKYDTPFDPGTVMGVIRGNQLAYLNTTADEASAVYRWQNGNLTVDSLQIKLGAGRIFGNLTIDNSQIAANISAENIKLGQILARPKDLTALDGTFMGNMTLEGNLAGLKGKINGELVDLAWDKKPIGTVQGELEYDNRQKEITFQELTLNSRTGDYRVAGKVNFAARSPRMALQVNSENLNVKEFLNWLPVKSGIDADGIGKVSVAINGAFAAPNFNCQLSLNAPQIAGVQLEQGLLEFNGNLNKIHLTKCELAASNARVYMTGMVESDQLDLVIGGYCNDLESLQLCYRGNLLKGRLDLDGRLTGSWRAPVLAATLKGAEMCFGELQYPQMTARVKWAAPELEIYDTQLSGGENSISASGRIDTAKSLRCNLGFDVKNLQLRKLMQLANLPQDGFDGKFSGNIIMTGTFDNPQVRLNGAIAEGVLNSVPVTGEVTLSYGNDKLLIEKIGLTHSTGSFYATGIWEKGKALRLRGRLNEFPLQTVNPWLTSYGLTLSGLASADVGLEWSGARFNCDYQLESTNLQVNNDTWGSAFLSGDMNENGLNISKGTLNIKDGSLGVDGSIPWPEQMRDNFKAPPGLGKLAHSLNLRLLLKNIPANLLNAYVPNCSIGSGEFNGNLFVAGTLVRPEVSGKLECSNGQLEIPDLAFRVDAIQAGVTINKNHVLINNKATGNVGKGRISLTGEADFGNFNKINLNLDCEGSRVFFKNSFYDGFADVNLKLAGTFDMPILMGNITIRDAKVGGLSLAGNNKKAKNVWNPELDLLVKMGSKVRYRQIGVADVSVNGTLHIKGNLIAPLLGGEITTNQGVISFYSQTFKVDRGEAVFNYNTGFNPYLDIEASLPTQKAMIFLKVKGQAGTEILPVLSSQPALTQKEIFALLNWSDLTGEKPLTVDNMVEGNMGMVTDTLLGDVLYQIRDAVGFDYLYLETDYRSNEYRINAGDYITDKLFVSYTRYLVTPVEDLKDKWNYDYHVTPEVAIGGSYSATEGRSWRLIYTFDF